MAETIIYFYVVEETKNMKDTPGEVTGSHLFLYIHIYIYLYK